MQTQRRHPLSESVRPTDTIGLHPHKYVLSSPVHPLNLFNESANIQLSLSDIFSARAVPPSIKKNFAPALCARFASTDSARVGKIHQVIGREYDYSKAKEMC